MATDPAMPLDPAVTRLEALIAIAAKRVARAEEKLDAANRELTEARLQQAGAANDKRRYIAANPPAQPDLF